MIRWQGICLHSTACTSRGGQLVRVMQPAKRDIASSPRIEKLPLASLREALTRVVRFWKKDGRSGKWALNHPPDWCVRAIAERGSWPRMPVLRAVVEWPVLTPDGWVIQEPGFDELTGLLYQPQEVFPEVSAQPTQAEVQTAQAELLDLVCDFPFAGPEHRAAWLAGLLTPFARYAFDGPAPLFLIDKNVRGAGGSLLCDVVSLIATGRMAPKPPKSPTKPRRESASPPLPERGMPSCSSTTSHDPSETACSTPR